MATTCQHCHRSTDLFLCTDCTDTLRNMLNELPWLLSELEARIQCLDRVSVGTIGRRRRPDQLNVMDFDAAEQARNAHKIIRDLVTMINGNGTIELQCTVGHSFIGPLRPAWRRLPAGYQPRMIELVDWLLRRVAAISRHRRAGHVYQELARLVGDGQRGGVLVQSINPVESHLVGPCPSIVGRDHHGRPRACGHQLFADVYDRTTTCPQCGQEVAVAATRERAAAERDLHTKTDLVELLDAIGEPVDEEVLTRWIATGRLRPAGYVNDGMIVEFRITDRDQPVFSVRRARRIRARNDTLRARHAC